MGLHRVKDITKALKTYDGCLYAQETKLGRLDVYRKSTFGCNPPHFLFSLTDTWQPQGTPIDYGIDTVLNRVKAHDLWRDDGFIENWIKNHEAFKESQERERKNSIESFLYDFRSQFKKTFSDVNTANLEKIRKEI